MTSTDSPDPNLPTARPTDRHVTADLILRYDRPGPRYTSYPTAVEFAPDVDAARYEARLAQIDRRADEPLSVYVHLPFCEERCLFCGCHVIISPDPGKVASYLDLLMRELDLVCEHLPNRRLVSQLHLGGGTPTYHAPEELDRLLGFVGQRLTFTPDAERAVEVDPRVTTPAHIDVLARHGFSRISLGVQDFDPVVQAEIGREQSYELTARLVEHCRSVGFAGINVDLIYGLPKQRVERFSETVQQVVDLGADRAAVYSFAFVPWIRGHQKKIEEESLPSSREKIELFCAAREGFLSAGFEPIGMDHFARPDDELAVARREGRLRRNFQGYAVIPADDVIGLGISAIGDVGGLYAQNAKKLSTYREAIEAGRLPVERGYDRSADDELRRAVIHDLMCNFRIDVGAIEERFGIRFAETFAEDLEQLAGHARTGLVEIGDREIRATPAGELLVRNLAMCFDRYQRRHEDAEGPVFSRTV